MARENITQLIGSSYHPSATSETSSSAVLQRRPPAEFRRFQHSRVRDVEAFEIEYRTRHPLHLRFRNQPGFHVHLRRHGTGHYSIDNAGVIKGEMTEMQVYCSTHVWFKDVFETTDVSPRNMLFGVPRDAAIKLLGGTAEAIFQFSASETFHARLRMRPDLISLIDELFELEQDGISGIRHEARMLDILALSLTTLQTSLNDGESGYRMRPGDVTRLRTVEQYIAQNLAAELSTERLAKLACMSVSRFKSMFRDIYDMPVGSYVRATRMKEAARLLRQGLAVGEVALRVGFRHPGHFARQFRNTFGLTPHAYASQAH